MYLLEKACQGFQKCFAPRETWRSRLTPAAEAAVELAVGWALLPRKRMKPIISWCGVQTACQGPQAGAARFGVLPDPKPARQCA